MGYNSIYGGQSVKSSGSGYTSIYSGGTKGITDNYSAMNAERATNQQKAPAAPKPSPSVLNKSFHGWSLGRTLTDIGHGAKSAGKAVISPVVDVAKGQGGKAVHDVSHLSSDVTFGQLNKVAAGAKSEISHIANPGKGPGVQNIMQAQAAAQKAVASGKVSPKTVSSIKYIQSPQDKITAFKIAADKTLNQTQITAKLKPLVAKQTSQNVNLGSTIASVIPLDLGLGVKAAREGLGAVISRAKGALPIPKSALDNHIVEEAAQVPEQAATNAVTGKVTKSPTGVKQVPTKSLTSYEGAPDTAKVAAYKQQIQSGKTLKPIIAVKDSLGNLGVEDGKHRLEAYKQLGINNVPVIEKTAPTKVSGSALRTQAKAVETGMKGELPEKATYNTQSYKTEAENAVKLLKENPTQANEIAMGRQAGNNASHEAAVYHAVANDALASAKKTGDFSKVTELASSPRHTVVSEAAQRLGAEGHNVNPHDPIKIMSDIAQSRQKAVGKSITKEATNIGKQVKARAPKISRQNWHDFVGSLQCK